MFSPCQCPLVLLLVSAGCAQVILDTFQSRVQRVRPGRARTGRQQTAASETRGGQGVDFSGCVTDQQTGLCCVDKVVHDRYFTVIDSAALWGKLILKCAKLEYVYI